MTHPLIEKVAQAIYEAHQGEPGDRGPWEQRASIDDLIYPPEAQAAIDTVLEAIREPSEAMVQEGFSVFPEDGYCHGVSKETHPAKIVGPDDCYTKMIDALRAELKEPGA